MNRLLTTIIAGLSLVVASVATVVGATPSAPATVSPFGFYGKSCIPQMKEIRCLEMHTVGGTEWRSVEPSRGKWTYGVMDKEMRYLSAQHIRFGGLLLGACWDKSGKRGWGFPVAHLNQWSNYVTHVVGQAHGKIKYWQVWNNTVNEGNRPSAVADYAKIMVSAYIAAHAAEPTCLVGLTASSANVNFLKRVIQAGARNHFDYITLYPYESMDGLLEKYGNRYQRLDEITINYGSEPAYLHIIATIRKMLAAVDPSRANCPINFILPGRNIGLVSVKEQGYAMVKAYAMGIAQGVNCIYWQGRDVGDVGGLDGHNEMGMLTAAAQAHPKKPWANASGGEMGIGVAATRGNPRVNYTVMQQMIKILGEHPKYLGWVLLNKKDYGFTFQGHHGAVLCTWAPIGTSNEVGFGSNVEITDPLTGKTTSATSYHLTAAPILVTGVSANLVQQARSDNTRPFPWNGDYSHAKSVSIVMGRKPVAQGLHFQVGHWISEFATKHNHGLLPGNMRGANIFIVDPNFLSYTTVPIEIRVQARRISNKVPAKMILTYESTKGFTTLPAQLIPPGKHWSTITWKINNDQFVNRWNYNFLIRQGPYYLSSVTVRKLNQ